MLLALDLGNSSLKGAFFDGPKLVRTFSVPVKDFAGLGKRLAQELSGLSPEVDTVALGSVNPRWVHAIRESLRTALPDVEMVLIGRDVKVPVGLAVNAPDEVGVDRLLDAAAAFKRARGAAIIVDFGSAITVEVVTADGNYQGGVIAPGIRMAAHALHDGTALLPKVEPAPVERVCGKDTISCIRSALYWGTLGMVEGLVKRLKAEYPGVKRVYATGGDAAVFAAATDAIDEFVPELTLEGIRITMDARKPR